MLMMIVVMMIYDDDDDDADDSDDDCDDDCVVDFLSCLHALYPSDRISCVLSVFLHGGINHIFSEAFTHSI